MRDLPSGWGTSDNENPWAEKQTPSVPAPQETPAPDAALKPASSVEESADKTEPQHVPPEELPMQDDEPEPASASAPYSAPPAFPVSAPPVSAGGKPKFLLPAACVLGVLLLGGGGLLLGKHFSEQNREDSAVRTVLEHDTSAADTTTKPAANTTTAPANTTTAMRTENTLFSALTEPTTASTAAASQSIVTSVSIVTITEAPAHSVPQTQAPPPQTEAPVQTQAPAATQPAETMPVIEPKPVEVNYDPAEVPFMPDPNTTYETWDQAYFNCIHYIVQTHPDDPFYQTQSADDMGYMFDLVDVSRDGIPELFISSGPYHMADLWMYTYENSRLVLVDDFVGTWGECSTANQRKNIYLHNSHMGYSWAMIYEMTGTSLMRIIDLVYYEKDWTEYGDKSGGWVNGTQVSDEIYGTLFDQYIKASQTNDDIENVGRRYPMMIIYSDEPIYYY